MTREAWSVSKGEGPTNPNAATVYALTSAGKIALQRVGAARTRRIADLVGDWTQRDIRTFSVLLARFNQSIIDKWGRDSTDDQPSGEPWPDAPSAFVELALEFGRKPEGPLAGNEPSAR